MKNNYTQDIKQFFKAYEERFNNALQGKEDADGTAAAFADCFVEANPYRVICGSNNEEFRKRIPAGNEHYRKIGTQLMRADDVQVTELNEMHFAARVSWHSEYKRQDGKDISIDFDVTYLLQHRDGVLKIFAYITGDEEGEMRKHGLI